MIVHLNGWPGAGKLAVGRALARLLGARLVDNHTLHNVAFATSDYDSAARWSVYYAVRDIAYAQLRNLPKGEVFVMTNAFTDRTDHGSEGWDAVRQLAADRGDRLVAVMLDCSLEENVARLCTADRLANRKLVDEEVLRKMRKDPTYSLLRCEGADLSFCIENSTLTAEEAARQIAKRIDAVPQD